MPHRVPAFPVFCSLTVLSFPAIFVVMRLLCFLVVLGGTGWYRVPAGTTDTQGHGIGGPQDPIPLVPNLFSYSGTTSGTAERKAPEWRLNAPPTGGSESGGFAPLVPTHDEAFR